MWCDGVCYRAARFQPVRGRAGHLMGLSSSTLQMFASQQAMCIVTHVNYCYGSYRVSDRRSNHVLTDKTVDPAVHAVQPSAAKKEP